MSTLIVTGGAGFIGSNFIRYWLEAHPDDRVANFDLLTYAGNRESLGDLEDTHKDRYRFVQGDIANSDDVNKVIKEESPSVIVNFAAESHNSRAVIDPGSFFHTNVLGTQTLLQACVDNDVPHFHHISTCEVYGDLPVDSPDKFTEESPYLPRTPYNASKAGGDLACRSYSETFGLPITISNCCNNYGPYQFPEKVIPHFAVKALGDEPLPLYKSSHHKREWLHVIDHCKAIDVILERGKPGETYNVGSGREADVEEIADLVLSTLGKDAGLKTYVEDRPGHDRRYLLDSSKIERELGWKAETPFESGMQETIEWYRENEGWWKPLLERLDVQESAW
jgi:dTDP-glucose 4,6-dehydratase